MCHMDLRLPRHTHQALTAAPGSPGLCPPCWGEGQVPASCSIARVFTPSLTNSFTHSTNIHCVPTKCQP
jgi:hypothetical protein